MGTTRQKGIKMQHPALRVSAFLVLAVVSAQPVANRNNSSSAIPLRRKRQVNLGNLGNLLPQWSAGDSTTHYLYCPTGEKSLALTSSEIRGDRVMEEFEDYCQCDSDRDKSWQTDRSDYYCGVESLGDEVGNLAIKAASSLLLTGACKIHDMCYETGRSQLACDAEFTDNLKELCHESWLEDESWIGWANSWFNWIIERSPGLQYPGIGSIGTDCDAVASSLSVTVTAFGSTSQTDKGREMMQCRGRL